MRNRMSVAWDAHYVRMRTNVRLRYVDVATCIDATGVLGTGTPLAFVCSGDPSR